MGEDGFFRAGKSDYRRVVHNQIGVTITSPAMKRLRPAGIADSVYADVGGEDVKPFAANPQTPKAVVRHKVKRKCSGLAQ